MPAMLFRDVAGSIMGKQEASRASKGIAGMARSYATPFPIPHSRFSA
jgi:hypothetical protein